MLCKVIAIAIGLLLSLVTFQAATIQPDPNLMWDSPMFSFKKLPGNVVPTHYNITLNLLDSSYVEGTVKIEVDHREVEVNTVDCSKSTEYQKKSGLINRFRPTSHDDEIKKYLSNLIVLHVDASVQINQVQYRVKKDLYDVGEKIEIVKYYYDSKREMLSMKFAKEFEPGSRGYLEFEFTLETKSSKSLFVRNYKDGRRFIANRFIPTGARYMMPCFDEPQYKTTFQLTLQHKNTEDALSNVDVDKQREGEFPETKITEFKKTPKMSIHMLAFVVSQLDSVGKIVYETSVNVYTPPGLSENAKYALDMACESIEWMVEYFDHSFPLDKFDIVITLNQERDNYENWGLASIRADQSLFDDEAQLDNKIAIELNVAHVVAHQWFANLITVSWWDDLWITEGIAAQMAFEFLLKKHPEHQESFVGLTSLFGVTKLDSRYNPVHSLSQPADELVDSEQIYNIYDRLPLMKSASLIQLIQNDLGETKFQKVLQSLLKNYAYRNINKSALIGAINSIDPTKDESYLDQYSTYLIIP